MVPVPAITCPWVSSPGVSVSTIARVCIIPADGPPTAPASIETGNGGSVNSPTVIPIMAWPGSSGRCASSTSTVLYRLPDTPDVDHVPRMMALDGLSEVSAAHDLDAVE